jgi:hypothetical protein
MGIRLGDTFIGALLIGAVVIGLAPPASAVTKGPRDEQIARTGVFIVADFPAGFAARPATGTSHAENIRLAKGVPGCAPFIALEKLLSTQPQAESPDFADDSRTISNEVDVFKSEKAAAAALAIYAKPSMASCFQKLFKKQLAQDPATKGKIESVSITLDRQDIAGLGDDSVVYEGNMLITGTDGSTLKVGIGNAAVQVGRTVDDAAYRTTSADLTEVLTPAIDASVARLETVLSASNA